MRGTALIFCVLLGSSAAIFAGDDPTFRVQSKLVLVPVTVTDLANRSVTGLDRETFRVFDGRNELPVTQFAREDAPVSVGIVFDASGSMIDKMAKAREAVAKFLETANPEDEYFLVEFADHARVTVPFTSEPGDILSRLQGTRPAGRTALIDAVALAVHSMKQAKHSRRALLVISDGGDNDSRFTAAELRPIVRETDVWIYAVGLYARTVMLPEQEDAGDRLLVDLAAATGGRAFTLHDAQDLPDVTRRIGLELRNQYILGVEPGAESADGRYHRLQVKVSGKNLHVSARPGYYQ